MNTCPNCGHTLDWTDCYDTEYESKHYYDYCYGECSHCHKKWEWTEVYVFQDVMDVEEAKDENN